MATTYQLRTIEERLIRMETRLCKLMIHMGLDQDGQPHSESPPVDYTPDETPAPEKPSIFSRFKL